MNEIQKLEQELFKLGTKLAALKKEAPAIEVPDYTFKTLDGEIRLDHV